MIPDRPEASVWLDIPDTCRMRGEFSGDLDIMIMFGDPDDGVNVLFKRPALERCIWHRPGARSGLCTRCGVGWPCMDVRLAAHDRR